MATKKITRKIVSSLPKKAEPLKKDDIVTVEKEELQEASPRVGRSKRGCLFCQNKSIPTYTDLTTLRRFLTDRAKIVARERSGVCSKHQRAVAKNIKYARHLATALWC